MHRIRRNPLAAAFAAVLAADLLFLVSGCRVLVREERHSTLIVPGSMHAGFYVAPVSSTTLECSYFTGRGVQTASVSTLFRDECPFLIRV
jgi:hypothetical protein